MMDVSTVCETLSTSQAAGNSVTSVKCVQFIKDNFIDLYEALQTRLLDREVMEALVSADDLRADEGTVYAACVDWARHRLDKQSDLHPSQGHSEDARVREELGDMLYRIRLPLMDFETFSKLISGSAVLSADEKLSLIKYIGSRSGRKDLVFDCWPRTGATDLPLTAEHVCNRYTGVPTAPENNKSSPLIDQNQNNIPNQFRLPVETSFITDAIDFETNKNIHLTALGLYAGLPSHAPSGARSSFHSVGKSPESTPKQADKLPCKESKFPYIEIINKTDLSDSKEAPPLSPESPTVSAHSVVLELLEAGLPITGRPTKQYKAYQAGHSPLPVRVGLREPVLITAGVRYTVVVKATGPGTYRGTGGCGEVTVRAKGAEEEIAIKFFKSKSDFNGTNVEMGQIPQIYFTV